MNECDLHSFQEALATLGVCDATLSAQEKRCLEEEGYLLLPHVMDAVWLAKLRERFEELVVTEGELAGSEYIQESGTRRLATLANKGSVFDHVYTHPKILAAVSHIIGRDFRLDMLNGRDTLFGHGLQKLHVDWGARRENEPFHAVNTIWMLDDFTSTNGATRLVPRTHLLAGLPDHLLDDPWKPHSAELCISAPAGTVLVYNAHLWHSGTMNRSEHTRRSLHGFYIANEFRRPYGVEINEETLTRLSPAARCLLGV